MPDGGKYGSRGHDRFLAQQGKAMTGGGGCLMALLLLPFTALQALALSWHIKKATAGAPVSGRRQQASSVQRKRVQRPQQSPRRGTDSKRPRGT